MSGRDESRWRSSFDPTGIRGGPAHDVAAMAASAPDAVVVEDEQRRIVAFNAPAERLFGYLKKQVLGRASAELLGQELTGRSDEVRRQIVFCRGDGSYFLGDVSLRTIDTENGALVIAAIRDISAQKALEERLRQESEAKNVSVAFAAHELRTPLNAIVGFGQLLCEGEIEFGSPQYKEVLGYILSCGWHLLGLVNDILDLQRMETGAIAYRPVPVDDVGRVIGDAVTMLEPVARAKAIDVQVAVEPEVNQAVIDPARLKQVVCNYLSNALKFTGRGGRVSIRLRAEGPQFLRLEVQDNGSGIKAREMGQVFKEFPHVGGAAGRRRSTGTGLGLVLMKQLVEAQGGSVGVHSRPGKGSVFFATFINHRQPSVASDNQTTGDRAEMNSPAVL